GLERERNPSMVAIAACAHALEGLYVELVAAVGPQIRAELKRKPKGKKRTAERVVTAVGCGFDVDASVWPNDIDQLFTLRTQLVHPRATFAAPVPHPLGVGVPEEYGWFSP